ncbi:hypothetical protein K7G98_03220, partial [Saccharothrix sp. MB29]|nr:hypothetical protein [Saccharothrix sp. MB29]
PVRLPKGNTAVRIITWNANRTNRWDLLWADPLVAGLAWDVICLQEVGNPDVAHWTHAQGPVWTQDRAARDTDESFVQRRYTYQPAHYPAVLHITHTEWGNRQKNHLTIITHTRPAWAAEIGGDMSDRPVLGIKVRLALPAGPTDVLSAACTSSPTGPSPPGAGRPGAVPRRHVPGGERAGLAARGRLQLLPTEMVQSAGRTVGVWYPPFSTQTRSASRSTTWWSSRTCTRSWPCPASPGTGNRAPRRATTGSSGTPSPTAPRPGPLGALAGRRP